MTRFTRRAGIAVAAAALALSGCVASQPTQSVAPSGGTGSVAPGLPPAVAQSGTIRIGTSPDFPPMGFKDPKDTSKTIGADIDLMNAIGAKLGVKVEIVESPFDQLLNSVATGRVDVVMSGISDTVDRQKSATFVDYFNSQGRFYTIAGKESAFTEADSICGKKVAVSSKTDFYDQIAVLSKEVCESKGKPAIERLGTDSGAAARLQIEQGRADLAVQAGENLAYLESTDPGKFKVVLAPLPGTPFGAVVKKDDMALANALLQAFKDIQASGEYEQILKKWGLQDGAMEPVINGTK